MALNRVANFLIVKDQSFTPLGYNQYYRTDTENGRKEQEVTVCSLCRESLDSLWLLDTLQTKQSPPNRWGLFRLLNLDANQRRKRGIVQDMRNRDLFSQFNRITICTSEHVGYTTR
jgi:hypothetical protein